MKIICMIFALYLNHDGTVRQEIHEKGFGYGDRAFEECLRWRHQREFTLPTTSALAEHYECVGVVEA